MGTHHDTIVTMPNKTMFLGEEVTYTASCHYCYKDDIYYMDEEQSSENDLRMKTAYKVKVGLLTRDEIKAILTRHNISATDLSTLLGWKKDTIDRYMTHSIQSKEHDKILRNLDSPTINKLKIKETLI